MLQRKTILGGLVAVAVACALALVLNWAVLGLFGQKSPDRAQHGLVGVLLLLGVVMTSAHNWAKPGEAVGVVALALVPCYLGTAFPDWGYPAAGDRRSPQPSLPQQLVFPGAAPAGGIADAPPPCSDRRLRYRPRQPPVVGHRGVWRCPLAAR